jgi:hypothetical protein
MYSLYSTKIENKKINPVVRSSIALNQENSQITNSINQNTKFNLNKFSLKKQININLKAFNLYNQNFNNYLEKHNNLDLITQFKKDSNLDLIKEIKIPGKEQDLDIRILNYFNKIDQILQLKTNSLYNNKIILFIPTQEINSNNKYKNNSTKYKNITNNSKEENQELILQNEKNKLLIQGKELINELNSQINLKNNIIKKNRTIVDKIESNLKIENSQRINNNLQIINISNILTLFEKKLSINKSFYKINKSNEINIEQIIKSNLKNKNFDYKTDSISINSNPISVEYSVFGSNKKPIINKFLKSLSIYNLRKNGIFINYRLLMGYYFDSNINKLIINAYNLLSVSFKSMYCLISKPKFIFTPDKVTIQLFYYLFIPNILKLKKIYRYGYSRRNKLNYLIGKKRKSNIKKLYRKFRNINVNIRIKLRKLSNITLSKVFTQKIENLCEILSNSFKKSVELELIRLHYPYNDSNILVNLLGIMINKFKLRIPIRRLFKKAVIKNLNKINTVNNKNKVNIIPAFLSGITIKVAGRLLKEKIVPRQTITQTRRGALAKGKINFYDIARFTNKNKRGAFTITISSGQNYF